MKYAETSSSLSVLVPPRRTTLQCLEDLNAAFQAKKESLPAALAVVRQGQTELDVRKTELNAIAALFIEEIWKKVQHWIDTHPETLGLSRFTERGELVPSRPVSSNARELKSHTGCVLSECALQCADLWEARRKLPATEKTALDRAYDRYCYLMEQETSRREFRRTPDSHLISGINTGNGMMWAMVEVAGKVFSQQFNRKPTQAELREVTESGLQMAHYLSASHLEPFIKILHGALFKKDSEDLMPFFDPGAFSIAESGGRLILEIVPEKFSQLTTWVLDDDNVRTGCPALNARTETGRTVMREFRDWILNICDRYYFPYQGHFITKAAS